jgi:hypothetical protein
VIGFTLGDLNIFAPTIALKTSRCGSMKESSCEVLKRFRKSYEISRSFAEAPKLERK